MPTAPATIYEKIVGPPAPERLLLLNTRSLMIYPFEATNWHDLRVGFFLSLTTTDDDDTPADPTMVESFDGDIHGVQLTDCYFIGVLDRTTLGTFFGFTNANASRNISQGHSELVSSDGGIGTTNSHFWRPQNASNTGYTLSIIDGGNRRGGVGVDGSQIHFAQVPASAGGYATLLAIRLQRDTSTSRTITLTAKRDLVNHSGDILFSNNPSSDTLVSHLETFPTTVQQLGPFEVTNIPDALYLYWPFRFSRLRCHALGLLKAE